MNKAVIFALTLISTPLFAIDLSENQIDNAKVSANGKHVTLLGNGVEVGQKAPNFKVVDDSFVPVTLDSFSGKAVLISVVPSLDTGICSLQTKHFNEKVAGEYKDVVMLTISADLPFAQKRFCQAQNIDKVQTLSDSVWHDFGKNYGLYIKDMGLLSRAVFILNKEHQIVYKQLVEDLATEPNYDNVITNLKAL
ncbi:Thiol peroxidase [Pseudoalteromonas holothuriae]|uniref:Thiol peroxidase n=1 Tax=Pseudoalteromonas holothuriae TaxID=2963714 RepID=A0ABM9GGW9_9GAMM|nr:thiol peroxidase [Pseudoalteromonas sp. CIP111951]CAH9056892.1 Thiol peroxidase [Pseudoalteromonas sp. CIP111951]